MQLFGSAFFSSSECDAVMGAFYRKVRKICLGVQVEKAEPDLLLFTDV